MQATFIGYFPCVASYFNLKHDDSPDLFMLLLLLNINTCVAMLEQKFNFPNISPSPHRHELKIKSWFVLFQVPGGSASNKMIYGTDELLRQARLKEQENNPSGFLYGTDAATRVGKAIPAPRPNNSIWLEERT